MHDHYLIARPFVFNAQNIALTAGTPDQGVMRVHNSDGRATATRRTLAALRRSLLDPPPFRASMGRRCNMVRHKSMLEGVRWSEGGRGAGARA